VAGGSNPPADHAEGETGNAAGKGKQGQCRQESGSKKGASKASKILVILARARGKTSEVSRSGEGRGRSSYKQLLV